MLSSVLHSERAAEVNIAIMRTFVKLRRLLLSDHELARKVEDHDHKIAALLDAVQKLLALPEEPKRHSIGFLAPKD